MPATTEDIGRRNAIPILYTRGTHYEVGFDVGRTFRGIIEDFLGSFSELRESLLPAYETEEGRAAYDATLKNLEENYPQYVREIQGTADGAKVPFHHLMLLHMDQIVPMNSGQERSAGTNGCSSICCNHEGQVLLGHTEDALPQTLNHIYLVSAHINEEEPQGRMKTKTEGFTALCYAGHLPGFCMGYNHHGLVFSVNVISPKKVLAGKTPRHFLCRSLLSAENMVEAQTILRDRGVGSADGFSINMSFTRQEGDHLFHNAEVGPAEEGEESPMSVLTISPGEHLLHTNKYLRLQIPEDEGLCMASSEHRHARAGDCCPPETRTALLALLSDTHDTEYPFFREGGDPDFVKTVTLGVFDLEEKTWTLWMKNPRTADPILTLPLVFKWTN
ncbi:C45 family peptidase tan [Oratosquilla oratoria]|uniref:C45 family peptidase tan n=1 Tax=Oratosquilla oratoria TaxID=337810 RepID=UPI003F76B015